MTNAELKKYSTNFVRQGGVCIYPTETAYALGGDARVRRVVNAIFKIKGRAQEKSLPVIAASATMAAQFCFFNPRARALAKKHWPGALTLVLPARTKELVARSAHNTVAVRVSPHPVAQLLSRACGAPVISTSANKSGEPTCYLPTDILHQFGVRNPELLGVLKLSASATSYTVWRTTIEKTPVLIIDAGMLPQRPPSTIVRVHDDRAEIIRQGSITV